MDNDLRLVVPVEDTILQLDESVLTLDDFGLTVQELVELSLESWADANGLYRRGYLKPPPEFALDPFDLLQERIREDLIKPNYSTCLPYDELVRLDQVLTGICFAVYLDIDKYLFKLEPVLVNGGFFHLEQWLGWDILMRIETLRM